MAVYQFPQQDKINLAPQGSLLNTLMQRADIPVENVEKKPFTSGDDSSQYLSTQSWDKITEISQVVSQMLVEVAIEINRTIRIINQADISNKEIEITVDGLKRDLVSFTDKIVNLKQKHEGKSGTVANADEYSASLSIGLEYMSLNEEIRALLFQPLTTLTEYANVAVQQLNAKNPSVVTDVEVKSVA